MWWQHFNLQAGWPAGWLAGRLAAWLAGWSAGWLAVWSAGWLAAACARGSAHARPAGQRPACLEGGRGGATGVSHNTTPPISVVWDSPFHWVSLILCCVRLTWLVFSISGGPTGGPRLHGGGPAAGPDPMSAPCSSHGPHPHGGCGDRHKRTGGGLS